MFGLKDTLASGSKSLEHEFFLKEDKLLIENLKTMKKLKETKENLSAVSGIKDDNLLQKLVDLKIHPETVATLALVPLVEIAWADGEINAKEREAILKAASQSGFAPSSVDYSIVDRWLTHKPDAKLLEAWSKYIAALCSKLTIEERASLKLETIGQARAVAEASGGILGLGTISTDEQKMLQKLESAFC